MISTADTDWHMSTMMQHERPLRSIRVYPTAATSGAVTYTCTFRIRRDDAFFARIAQQVAAAREFCAKNGVVLYTSTKRHCSANCPRAHTYTIEKWMPWCPECGAVLESFETVEKIGKPNG